MCKNCQWRGWVGRGERVLPCKTLETTVKLLKFKHSGPHPVALGKLAQPGSSHEQANS